MLAGAFLLIQSDLFIEIMAQLRPDSNITASDVQEVAANLKNPFMVFSLPNVIFLIWLISDFFKLGSMVREQNARLGLGEVDFVYERDDRSAESLSNAKVPLYIALGLNLLNVAAYYIDSVKAEEVGNISFIATICFAVGLYFASRSMRSKRLLFNFTIFGVFWYLNALVLVGRVFFENSMLLTALATFCTAVFFAVCAFGLQGAFRLLGRKNLSASVLRICTAKHHRYRFKRAKFLALSTCIQYWLGDHGDIRHRCSSWHDGISRLTK